MHSVERLLDVRHPDKRRGLQLEVLVQYAGAVATGVAVGDAADRVSGSGGTADGVSRLDGPERASGSGRARIGNALIVGVGRAATVGRTGLRRQLGTRVRTAHGG